MASTSDKNAAGLYERLVAAKPAGAAKYRSMRDDLKSFGAADLYEYACPLGYDDPRSASNAELIARAEERMGEYGRNTSERSAAERLRSRAREIFEDDSSARMRYDEYLDWCELKHVCDRCSRSAKRTDGVLNADDAQRATEELGALLGSNIQGAALLESFCAANGFTMGEGQPAGAKPEQKPEPEPELEPEPEPEKAPATKKAASSSTSSAKRGRSKSSRSSRAHSDKPRINPYAAAAPAIICECGRSNPVNTAYCSACGRPLGGSKSTVRRDTDHMQAVAQQQYAQPRQQPVVQQQVPAQSAVAVMPVKTRSEAVQPAEKGKGPIIGVIIGLALVIVIGVCVWFFLFSNSSGSASSSSASSSSGPTVVSVPSGYVDNVECSLTTAIIPFRPNDEPFDLYRAQLNPRGNTAAGTNVFPELSVDGTGGFSLNDFNGRTDDGKSYTVTNGEYELVMTDTKTGHECRIYVNYSPTNDKAKDRVEVHGS